MSTFPLGSVSFRVTLLLLPHPKIPFPVYKIANRNPRKFRRKILALLTGGMMWRTFSFYFVRKMNGGDIILIKRPPFWGRLEHVRKPG